MEIKDKIVASFKLGAWVTATVLVLNYLLSFAKIDVIQLYGLQPVSGISATIASKATDFINGLGLITLNWGSLVLLYLSAVAVVFAGSLIYGLINFPKTTKDWTKLTAILFWGTVPFGILLTWGFKLPAFTAIIMLAVYYGAVALTLGLLQNFVTKFVKF